MTVLQAYPDNQGAQQILEKIKIDGHLISYFSDNPVSNTADCSCVHGSWMDVWQIRERGLQVACIGPGSNINLFVQPFPRYLIKAG